MAEGRQYLGCNAIDCSMVPTVLQLLPLGHVTYWLEDPEPN